MAENDGDNKNQDINKFLIMTIASIVILLIVFLGVNYFIMENLIRISLDIELH